MGFYKSPSRMHYGSEVINDIYIGCGNNLNECIVKWPGKNNWYHYNALPIFSLTTSQGTFAPYGSCGGQPAFKMFQGHWSIYYSNYFRRATTIPSQTYGTWLLVKDAPYIGYIPRATISWDAINEDWVYSGDTWYSTESLLTFGDNGEAAGTFTGVSEDVEGQTMSVTISVNPIEDTNSSLIGNWGSFYVGFPVWNFTDDPDEMGVRVWRRWNEEWINLRYINIDNIDGIPCTCTGYQINGMTGPTLNPGGFYMALNPPVVETDYRMSHYTFVPDDPDHPEEGVHLHKDLGSEMIAYWVNYYDEIGMIGIAKGRSTCKQIGVFEASIWR